MERTKRILEQVEGAHDRAEKQWEANQGIRWESRQVDGMQARQWQGGCLSIVLDRPARLNSLSSRNIIFLYEILLQAMRDDEVTHVVLHPLPAARASFCAGGDLKEFIACDRREFTFREYRLDYLIQQYPKPIVALIDGVAMGGGAGLACLSRFRVVTPHTVWAMPEASIGWNPDCGASFFLSSPRVDERNGVAASGVAIPGVGEYVAMTGLRLRAYDMRLINLATHFLPHTQAVSELLTQLQYLAIIEQEDAFAEVLGVLERACTPWPTNPPEESLLWPLRDQIPRHFTLPSVEAILLSLQAEDSVWAQDTRKCLLQQCPTILKIVRQTFLRARGMPIAECLKMEFRVGLHLEGREDLQEGVASVLIRKDRTPGWRPARVEDVDEAWIEQCFVPRNNPQGLELDDPPFPLCHEPHS